VPRTRRKHSPIYFRNTFIVWSSAIFTFLAAIFSPEGLATSLLLILLIYINYFLLRVYLSTHPMRRKQPPFTPSDATLAYEDVSLSTSDGLKLTAWYIPGKNRTAIILVHGLGGSKVHMLNHARALAFDGYGALMIDLRAHGGSEGDTITGVFEANDVLAGVEYLKTREDVDEVRIGAVGVSLGANAVLRAAQHSGTIRALILDGLGPVCLADHGGQPKTFRRKFNLPINWLSYRLAEWMCGVRITEGITAVLPRIWPRPVLLIAAGRGTEIHFNRIFFAAAREPKDLWEVPRAHHAAAYLFEPLEYREKIRTFFRTALIDV
jgi:pimeloyl-ACP methyl ester carboxylesterase